MRCEEEAGLTRGRAVPFPPSLLLPLSLARPRWRIFDEQPHISSPLLLLPPYLKTSSARTTSVFGCVCVCVRVCVVCEETSCRCVPGLYEAA